jgi:hypothetical protein
MGLLGITLGTSRPHHFTSYFRGAVHLPILAIGFAQ